MTPPEAKLSLASGPRRPKPLDVAGVLGAAALVWLSAVAFFQQAGWLDATLLPLPDGDLVLLAAVTTLWVFLKRAWLVPGAKGWGAFIAALGPVILALFHPLFWALGVAAALLMLRASEMSGRPWRRLISQPFLLATLKRYEAALYVTGWLWLAVAAVLGLLEQGGQRLPMTARTAVAVGSIGAWLMAYTQALLPRRLGYSTTLLPSFVVPPVLIQVGLWWKLGGARPGPAEGFIGLGLALYLVNGVAGFVAARRNRHLARQRRGP